MRSGLHGICFALLAFSLARALPVEGDGKTGHGGKHGGGGKRKDQRGAGAEAAPAAREVEATQHTFRGIEHFIPPALVHASKYGAVKRNHPKPSPKVLWHGKRDYGAETDIPGTWSGQAEQDQRVVALLEGKRGGYFVDLAANEPIDLSNSRALERDYGWEGLCIDGNQEVLEKLVAQRTCRVFKAAVSDVSGKEVEFTTPLVGGSWEDAMGGILSNTTDNQVRRPHFAKRQWHATKLLTVTLQDILDHVKAPSTIDYLSLDIEGAEYDALKGFDFDKYTFRIMTIERPIAALRNLLRQKGYVFLFDNACFGDQLWVHASMVDRAKEILRAITPSLYPGHVSLDRGAGDDFNLCCSEDHKEFTPGATIDNGCCGYVGMQSECVDKLKAAGQGAAA